MFSAPSSSLTTPAISASIPPTPRVFRLLLSASLLPPETKVATVSGVIIAPTHEISQNHVLQGDEAYVSGLTVPSSQVEAFLFETEQGWFLEIINTTLPANLSRHPLISTATQTLASLPSLISPVFARQGPRLAIYANERGEFEFNLPTHKNTLWRFFVGSHTHLGLSPQSTILEFRTLSWWQWLFLHFVRFLLHHFLSIIHLLSHPLAVFFLEVPLALYLIYFAFIKKSKNEPLFCLRWCHWPATKTEKKKENKEKIRKLPFT